MPRNAKRTGGSVASDAVESLVDPAVWPVLNDRFTNYTHNIAPVSPTDPAQNPLDAITLATGGCGCDKTFGGKKRRGGTVPASLPIGADTHGSLFKHSAEASFNAASPNIKTFPAMDKGRYGHPPVEFTAAEESTTGGAKKPTSKQTKVTKPKSTKPSPKKATTSKPKSLKPSTKTTAAKAAPKPKSSTASPAKKDASPTKTAVVNKASPPAPTKTTASATKKATPSTKANGAKKASAKKQASKK